MRSALAVLPLPAMFACEALLREALAPANAAHDGNVHGGVAPVTGGTPAQRA